MIVLAFRARQKLFKETGTPSDWQQCIAESEQTNTSLRHHVNTEASGHSFVKNNCSNHISCCSYNKHSRFCISSLAFASAAPSSHGIVFTGRTNPRPLPSLSPPSEPYPMGHTSARLSRSKTDAEESETLLEVTGGEEHN
eukprot:766963-Hanusia_phi.AAC.2